MKRSSRPRPDRLELVADLPPPLHQFVVRLQSEEKSSQTSESSVRAAGLCQR